MESTHTSVAPAGERAACRNTWLVAALLALAVVFLLSPGFDVAGTPLDEGCLLTYPDQILHGRLPYRDFETFYGPGNIYALAGVYAAFGHDIFVQRAVGLGYRLAIFAAIFWLARRRSLSLAIGCTTVAGTLFVPLNLCAYAWLGAVALALWAVVVATSATLTPRRVAIAGSLAGLALVYRADLAPAMIATAGVLLWRMDSIHRRWFLLTATAFATIPYLLLMAAVGLMPILENLLLAPVFRQHRSIPLSDSPFWLRQMLAFHGLAIAIGIAAGIRALRQHCAPPWLLAASVLGFGLTYQALQRFDGAHLLFGCFLSLSLLPAALVLIADIPSARRFHPISALLASAATITAIFVLSPIALPMVKLYAQAALATDLESPKNLTLNGRSFPMSPRRFPGAAVCLAALQRSAAPGDRLFVGTGDFRTPEYGDSFIYHLMPHLTPATYFLAMNPMSDERALARLATDLASADWLFLDHEWDDPAVLAAHAVNPDAALQTFRAQFERVCGHGSFELYRKKGATARN